MSAADGLAGLGGLEPARYLAAAAQALLVYSLMRSIAAPGRESRRLTTLRPGTVGGQGRPGRAVDLPPGGALDRCLAGLLRTRAASFFAVGPETAAALEASGVGRAEAQAVGVLAAAAGLGVYAVSALLCGGPPPVWLTAAVAAAALGGPRLWLSRIVDRHRSAVAAELPKAAELLTLGTESGLELLEAARMAATLLTGPVGKALAEALVEIDAGREQLDALRNMALRVGGGETATFVAALAQGLALGTPVARVLRVQADSLRARRRQTLESRISGLSLKLTVVTILFFVPALFILSVLPNLLAFIGGSW